MTTKPRCAKCGGGSTVRGVATPEVAKHYPFLCKHCRLGAFIELGVHPFQEINAREEQRRQAKAKK